jgi:hypothetical protein
MAAESYLQPMEDETEHHSMRRRIEDAFRSIQGVVKASVRPLPTQTGNGTYVLDPEHTSMLKDLSKLGFRDILTMADMIKAGTHDEHVEDSTYLMERVIQVLVTSHNTPNSTDWHSLLRSCLQIRRLESH